MQLHMGSSQRTTTSSTLHCDVWPRSHVTLLLSCRAHTCSKNICSNDGLWHLPSKKIRQQPSFEGAFVLPSTIYKGSERAL